MVKKKKEEHHKAEELEKLAYNADHGEVVSKVAVISKGAEESKTGSQHSKPVAVKQLVALEEDDDEDVVFK